MDETPSAEVAPPEDGAASGGEEPEFVVGPPHPVTDSRALPAVTADEEEAFVRAANLITDHPDNEQPEPPDEEVNAVPDPDAEVGEELPSEEQLGEVIADVDPDEVDDVGFDDADVPEGLTPSTDPNGSGSGGS